MLDITIDVQCVCVGIKEKTENVAMVFIYHLIHLTNVSKELAGENESNMEK